MAAGDPLDNTFTTGTGPPLNGQREDLSDVLTRISPTLTPGYSNYEKTSASAIYTEWQEEELDDVDTTGRKSGEDYYRDGGSIDAAVPTERSGNYTQILRRTWGVSGTLDAVDTAGRARETARQKALKGMALRRDIEAKLHDNQIASGTDPRLMAGLMTWLTTDAGVSQWGVTAGAAPTRTGGVPAAPATIAVDPVAIDGDWWKNMLNPVLQELYYQGGQPSMVMMTPKSKQEFSEAGTSAAAAPSRANIPTSKREETGFIGAIDVFSSDYGPLSLVMNRFIPGKNLVNPADSPNAYGYETNYVLDPRFISVAALPGRNFTSEVLPKTGDATNGRVLTECTLRMTSHKSAATIISP
jgi:hypothetical protein